MADQNLAEIDVTGPHCQRWRKQRHVWRPSGEPFDPGRYTVEPVDELVAKAYVVEHHYSGSYPAASRRYGLYEDGRLAGVMVLGIPAQAKVLTGPLPGLEPYVESLELSRFVLDDSCPGNSESWFLARGFELAAASGLRGIVSFADPVPRRVGGRLLFAGHVGTIYQASNALYAGRGKARSITLLPDGRVFSDRSAQKVRSQDRGHDHVERLLVEEGARPLRMGEKPAKWLAEALGQVGATRLRHGGCHRYVFAIGDRRQRRSVRINAGSETSYPKVTDS